MADYIMDMIDTLSEVLMKALLGKEAERQIDDGEIYIADLEYERSDYLVRTVLFRLISDGKIAEAEDALFKTVEQNPSKTMLKLSIEFYTTLSKMTEEELLKGNFSRDEIKEGIDDIKKYFKE